VEFLVHIEITWPPDADPAQRDQLFADELLRGQELARAGLLRRLWRIPGRWANWSLYEVPDATVLHDSLSSLPLWPYMSIDVHALAQHQNDPRLLGLGPEVGTEQPPAASGKGSLHD